MTNHYTRKYKNIGSTSISTLSLSYSIGKKDATKIKGEGEAMRRLDEVKSSRSRYKPRVDVEVGGLEVNFSLANISLSVRGG